MDFSFLLDGRVGQPQCPPLQYWDGTKCTWIVINPTPSPAPIETPFVTVAPTAPTRITRPIVPGAVRPAFTVPTALPTATAYCPAGSTRVEFVAYTFIGAQVICSVCIPDGDLTSTGGKLQRLCDALPRLVPGAYRSTQNVCPSGYVRVQVVAHTSFGASQIVCNICVPDGDLTATGGKLQRFCDAIAFVAPGATRASTAPPPTAVPTVAPCQAGYTRVDLTAFQFGGQQKLCTVCVKDGDLAVTGGKLQRLCDGVPGLVPGSYRAA